MAGDVKIELATSAKARTLSKTFRTKTGGTVEDRKLLPFYVRLPYITGPGTDDDAIAGIYLFSERGEEAANLAAVIWNKWFRSNVIATLYPKIKQDVNVAVTLIDDNDYDNAWKDAKKMPHCYVGHPDDPVAFMVKHREIFGVD